MNRLVVRLVRCIAMGIGFGLIIQPIRACEPQGNQDGRRIETGLSIAALFEGLPLLTLLRAVENGDRDAVKKYLDDGADPDQILVEFPDPLISLAIKNKYDEIAELLIAKSKNVNRGDDSNFTPLHVAAYKGSLEIVKALLAAGARKDVKNIMNKTPYDVAQWWGRSTEILDLLKLESLEVPKK